MADVFEGPSSDVNEPMSRFRPRYRALTDEEKALHDLIKGRAMLLEEAFSRVKSGRYAALAMTSLEESVMWIVKELTG